MAYAGRTKKLQAAMIAAGHPIDTNTDVLHFLMGLGPEYETEKKILTNMSTELRWNTTLSTLYPAERATAEAATTSEEPTVAAFNAGTSSGAPPLWPRDKPMPRAERRRRVVCWTCHTRAHYAHEFPSTADRPQDRGGGPSASFMATASRPRMRPHSDDTPDAGGGGGSPMAEDRTWLVDSGASDNMRLVPVGFASFQEVPSKVTVANGAVLDSLGRGSLVLPTSLGGELTLTRTLFVPDLATNLFSVRAADRAGGEIRFYGGGVTVIKDGILVAAGRVNKYEQYELSLAPPTKGGKGGATSAANVAYGRANPVGDLWHWRFGHLGYQTVYRGAKAVTGMTVKSTDTKGAIGAICEPCVKARLHVRPHGTGERAARQLQRLCVDLIGTILPQSGGGAVHVLTVIDDCTGLSFVTPLKTKAAAGAGLRAWITFLENQTPDKVNVIRTDGAKEILNNDTMQHIMTDKGIKAETSAPSSPKQNGKSERHNQVLLERTRAMLLGADVPLTNWAEAMVTATFLINRSPTPDGKETPYERFYGAPPDVSILRVWGCKECAKRPPKQAGKLDSRVVMRHLVGYASGGHAWRIRSATTGAIMTRRDVEFDETATSTPTNLDAMPVCLSLPEEWNQSDTASADEETGDAAAVDERAVPVVHNMQDAISLLPAARPPPVLPSVPAAPAATPQGSSDATAGTPESTHGYNLRARAARGAPSALSAAVNAADEAPAYAPVSVKRAVGRPDWCDQLPKTRWEAVSRPDAYL